jgi:excisionase family DNA binding protein
MTNRINMITTTDTLEKSNSATKLIPVKEIPKILPISLATVRSWIFSGKLPVVRLGRKVLVKQKVIDLIADEGLEALKGKTL